MTGIVILVGLAGLAIGFVAGRLDASAEAERRIERLPRHGPPLSHLRLIAGHQVFDQEQDEAG